MTIRQCIRSRKQAAGNHTTHHEAGLKPLRIVSGFHTMQLTYCYQLSDNHAVHNFFTAPDMYPPLISHKQRTPAYDIKSRKDP